MKNLKDIKKELSLSPKTVIIKEQLFWIKGGDSVIIGKPKES